MIDRILRLFRRFCRAYVDDIVIFSSSLEEHLTHLKLVFGALDKMNIHLSLRKSILGYPSVHLLGGRGGRRGREEKGGEEGMGVGTDFLKHHMCFLGGVVLLLSLRAQACT